MPNTPGGYIDLVSDKILDLEQTVDDHRQSFGAIYIDLLEHPENRDEGVWDWFIGYMMEHTASETGNEDLAVEYWQVIDDYFDWSWEHLHTIPPPERGDIWATARRVISATAQRQALIESGLAHALLVHATDTAKVVGGAAAKLSPAQKQAAAKATTIKSKVKEKREVRKNASRPETVSGA